jgi:tetratricopeptide (TPR) repeat protein
MKKLLAKARVLYKNDRYGDALPMAKRILAIDAQNDEALFIVAHSLYHARQFRRSLLFWKRLEKIRPNEPCLHLNMGACYGDIGKSALAIKHFKRELKLDPVCGKALYNLGCLYYRARKPKLAANYLERCYSQKHSVDAVVCKLAWCYFKTGQFEKEQILYEEYLQKNPNDTWALNNLGSHLMGQGQYNRALLRLKKAARLDPSDKLVAKNIHKAERLRKNTKMK